MLGSLPDRLASEDHQIGVAWRDSGFEQDIDVFIEANASLEYRDYIRKEKAHVEKMNRQGIMV